MGSKTTLKASYVKRLLTVAYVGAWLINRQATNNEPYQKCRPAKNFIFQTNQARLRRKNAAAKALTILPKADPVLGSKKRAPFWRSVFYVEIARYFFEVSTPGVGWSWGSTLTPNYGGLGGGVGTQQLSN